jgi:hypothetical protein
VAPFLRSPAARGWLISLVGSALMVLGVASAARRATRLDLEWRSAAFTRALDEKMAPGLGPLFHPWKLVRAHVPETESVTLLGLGADEGEWATPRLAALLYPRAIGDLPAVPPTEAQDVFLGRHRGIWFVDHRARDLPESFPPHRLVASEGHARLWKIESR